LGVRSLALMPSIPSSRGPWGRVLVNCGIIELSRLDVKGALRATAVIVAFFSSVAGLALETKLIPDSEIQKRRVRMSTVFYADLPTRPVRTPDFTLTTDSEGTPLAQGRDKTGHAWRIMLPPAIRGLWLAGNGIGQTYWFAGYTGGVGMAQDSWILAISFDDKARPSPFHIRSYAAYDAKGIKDLLQLGAENRILLQQTWLEKNWKPGARSGYYITSAYHEKGVFWYKTGGSYDSISFPAFERWVVPLPETTPELVSAPDLPNGSNTDYGNDPTSGTQTRIVGVDEHGIRTGPELSCNLEFIDVIVLDSAHGRDIEVGDIYPSNPDTLLPVIALHRAATTFTGLNRSSNAHGCTASIAWAHL
jgi:hypothetical protein